jgi:tetratricopeptide (TPR) repeat protein
MEKMRKNNELLKDMWRMSIRNLRMMGCVALSFIIFHLSFSPAAAQTKAEADSAYARGEFQKAIKDYEALLKQGVSADLYYNLGNAYYRTEDITRAVLNYERALQLSPGDKDIRFNLQMARSKTIDKITPETELFFVTWYRSLANMTSVDGWAYLALTALALAIVLALIYLFANAVWLRKLGFFCGIALLLLFVLANVLANHQKNDFTENRGAIIMGSAVMVKSTPAADGTDLFILHEGTKVTITDSQMKDWKQIRVADGKEGWVETKLIELI